MCNDLKIRQNSYHINATNERDEPRSAIPPRGRKVTVAAITRIFFRSPDRRPRVAKYISPAAVFSAPVSISDEGCARVTPWTCIARKYLAPSLPSRFVPSRSSLVPSPIIVHSRLRRISECIFRRVPMQTTHAMLIFHCSYTARISSHRACTLFRRKLHGIPVVETRRIWGETGSGASRNARKSGYLKIDSKRGAMAVHTEGRQLHTAMNADRIAAAGEEKG